MIKATWTGAAGLIFETENDIILVDPYYTRIDLLRTLFVPIRPDEAAIRSALPSMRKISAVIVGHTHSDHALDVPYIAERSTAKLLGSRSLETLMALHGLPGRATVCRGGETIGVNERLKVTMIRSAHGNALMGKIPFPGEVSPAAVLPMKAAGYRVGTVFAPKLTINETAFIHVGSANFLEAEMQGHTCDVLFICVAGWNKRQGYPRRLLDLTQPKTVVLFHYDNFSTHHRQGAPTRKLPLIDMKGLIRTIREHAPALKVIVPDIGDTMQF